MILQQYADVQPSMRYSLSVFYDYHPNQVKRRKGKVLEEQFRATDKPDAATIILVIDALDECGNTKNRPSILRALTDAATHAQWLKIIITSRPKVDIEQFFNGLAQPSHLRYDLTADHETTSDLRIFAQARFNAVASERCIEIPWPEALLLNRVVSRAAGLFIFVETIALALEHCDDPAEYLKATLHGSTGTGELSTHLGMTSRMTPLEVQVSFQNRRAKEKRLCPQAPSIPEHEAYLDLFIPFSLTNSDLSRIGMQLSRDCAEAPQLMGEASAPAMADCSPNAPSTIRNTQNNARWKSHEISSRLRLVATNSYFLPPPLMDSTTTTGPHLSLVSPQRSLLQLSTAEQTHRISASSPAFTPQGRSRQIPVVRGSQLTINHLGLPKHQFTPMETRTLMPLAPGAPSSSAPAPTPQAPPPPPPPTQTPADDYHDDLMRIEQMLCSSPWVPAAFIYDYPSCPDLANRYGDHGSPCDAEFEVAWPREEYSPYQTRRFEETGFTTSPSRPDLVVNRYRDRGISCYFDFWDTRPPREGCSSNRTPPLEDLIKHQSYHHHPCPICPDERHCLVSLSSPCPGRGLRVLTVFL